MSFFEIDLSAIGGRIKSIRGKLTQLQFAERLGVDRKTVTRWEAGERMPDSQALISLWQEFDTDPAWVLTGKGFEPTTTEDERELLALFRAAPLAVKASAVGALKGGIAPTPSTAKIQVGGAFHGQVVKVEGDQVNHGPLHIGPVTKGKKKK